MADYKIFISHKQEDEEQALAIQNILSENGVEAYLDLLDQTISGDGEKLTEHIKNKLRECTDIIVVLSNNTKKSWWVPFEIGMASEKDMPIANYLLSNEELPDYLEYWPRLKSKKDVEKYINIRRKVAHKIALESAMPKGIFNFASKKSETKEFYAELKKEL